MSPANRVISFSSLVVRAGTPITAAAIELGISAAALHKWVRQDQVDRGERTGLTTTGSVQSKVNKRILSTRSRGRNPPHRCDIVRGEPPGPNRIHPVIDTMRSTGANMSSKYKESSTGGRAVNVPVNLVEC